ncbi:MAG: sigma-70 family RNA polymerase sigma factor [Candidatus Sulfotelmatobacter sp.]|jgi:RNA polymerase sigma-70 factor (ECF subfamily)
MLPSPDQDDVSLLAKVEQRDPDALLALYRKYNTRVFSLIYRIVENRPAAEELLQDAFQRLWDRPQMYSAGKGPLLSWLLTVARNIALDYRRKESRRAAHLVTPLGEEEGFNMDNFPDLRSAADPDLSRTIRQAMESLPPAQKNALELAYFEGLTHQELAERTGESLGTVKTRIRLGISKLREALLNFGQVFRL